MSEMHKSLIALAFMFAVGWFGALMWHYDDSVEGLSHRAFPRDGATYAIKYNVYFGDCDVDYYAPGRKLARTIEVGIPCDEARHAYPEAESYE